MYGSYHEEGGKRGSNAGMKGGSICKNLSRKASVGLEESGVIGTSYTAITGDTSSPVKYATLPQANHVSHSPHSSPLR